jgi:hypothetical protein
MPLLPEPPSGNNSDAPIAGVVPVELMTGEDEEDTAFLRGMSQDAEAYLRSFSWCKEVQGSFFGGGVGGIIAVFLFNIRPARPEVSSWIWIIVGDIPSAYLPLEDAPSPAEIFKTYLRGMSKWLNWLAKDEVELPMMAFRQSMFPPLPNGPRDWNRGFIRYAL